MGGTVATYAFGNFVFDRQRARLLRDGHEIRLRPKSFELLAHLIENHGRLITKDELIKAVWPDSFVTDGSLVQCVRDIRRALDDDSQQYIKTVPRRGYIFEADIVRNLPDAGTTPVPAEVVARSVERPPARRFRRWVGPAMLTLAVISGVFAFAWYPSTRTSTPDWRPVPLTSYPGIEFNPAISPDNNSVAFTWNGEAQDNFDIYVQPAGQGHPRRLTTDPAQDTSPAWSPDGGMIAFLRRVDSGQNQLILIPAFGGSERILAETRTPLAGGNFDSDLRMDVAWAPGGQWIVVRHRETKETLEGFFLVSVSTGEKRLMIETPAGYRDANPAFSPNGDAIAFARHRGGASGLYIAPLSKDLSPSGPARPLTNERGVTHPVWSNDGSRILYRSESEGHGLDVALFVINARDGDKPQPIQSESANIRELSLARDLVYSQIVFEPNVWRAEIPPPNVSPTAPHVLISSTWLDTHGQYSPDGKTIAFLSTRSGHHEIWTSNADGSNQNPVQLTSFGPAGIRFPTWSHDGRRIVFHARPEGQSDLFSVAATGGSPKRLTSDPFDDIMGRYSRDGKWIYFSSNRSGRSEVWKIPADGGEATRVTTGGGVMPVESPDGKSVFFAHPPGTENGIWKIPAEGGEEKRVTGPIAKEVAFAVSREGIYYAAPQESPTRQLIYFLKFSTGQTKPVVVADREIGIGMSLSVDGRSLIFPQRDQVGSDLMLVRDFGLRIP